MSLLLCDNLQVLQPAAHLQRLRLRAAGEQCVWRLEQEVSHVTGVKRLQAGHHSHKKQG
jgi:hypothetical protein